MPLLPRIFKNDAIDKKQTAKLVDGKPGRRGQVNSLIYSVSQMPNASSDNNWPIFCRAPNKNSSQKFAQFNFPVGKGSILVKHLSVDIKPNSDLHSATKFSLDRHSLNRDVV